MVWAQNQTKSTETNGTSNYDLVAQRYDQTGQKVGGFIKITDTPTGVVLTLKDMVTVWICGIVMVVLMSI